jgi:hypothetical protein
MEYSMNTRYTNIITYLSDSKEGHYVIKYMSDSKEGHNVIKYFSGKKKRNKDILINRNKLSSCS